MQKIINENSRENNIKQWVTNKIKKIEYIEENWQKYKWYIHFDKRPYLIKWITLGKDKIQKPQEFFEDFFSVNNISKRWFWSFIRSIKEERKYKRHFLEEDNAVYFDMKKRFINKASYFDSYIY